jgi:hypothetical protein
VRGRCWRLLLLLLLLFVFFFNIRLWIGECAGVAGVHVVSAGLCSPAPHAQVAGVSCVFMCVCVCGIHVCVCLCLCLCLSISRARARALSAVCVCVCAVRRYVGVGAVRREGYLDKCVFVSLEISKVMPNNTRMRLARSENDLLYACTLHSFTPPLLPHTKHHAYASSTLQRILFSMRAHPLYACIFSRRARCVQEIRIRLVHAAAICKKMRMCLGQAAATRKKKCIFFCVLQQY